MGRNGEGTPIEGPFGPSEPAGASEPGNHLIDRRKFVIGAGALTGLAAMEQLARAAGIITVGPGIISTPSEQNIILPASEGVTALNGVSPLPGADITFLLRRREDFLFLQVDGYNLERAGNELKRKHAGDAYIVFSFQPQHVFEQAFGEDEKENDSGNAYDGGSGTASPPAPGKAAAQLAYGSRLGFLVPRTLDSITYSVDALLDWGSFIPNLVPAAVGSNGLDTNANGYAAPLAQQTSIELPWRLVISPSGTFYWSHPTDLLTANGSTELWHTRLANGTAARSQDGGTFRGVWTFDTFEKPNNLLSGEPTLTIGTVFAGSGNGTQSAAPDGNKDTNAPDWTSPMNAEDRWNIVQVTSNAEVPNRTDVQANRLWLSARGGVLDSIGVWDIPGPPKNSPAYPGAELVSWRHIATLGRDQYVKVVTKGYLFPFGHAVTMTKISERQFQQVDSSSGDETVGAFRQIIFLTVREPVVSYGGSLFPNDSLDFPFRTLRLVTQRTGFLETTQQNPSTGEAVGDVFLPTLASDGSVFQWHMIGTDWNGRDVSFSVPALFVSESQASSLASVRSSYNNSAASERTASLQGQTVAFGAQNNAGDTDLKVQQLIFSAGPGLWADGSDNYAYYDMPAVSPSLSEEYGGHAVVRLSAAEAVSGGGALSGNSTPAFSYYKGYVTGGGFSDSNVGRIFMKTADEVANMVFSGGSGGGMFTPNIGITGLSRSLGPVSGDASDVDSALDSLAGGTFSPESYFSQLESATILGGVSLKDLLQLTSDLTGGSPASLLRRANEPGSELRSHDSTPDDPNSDVPQISYTNDGTSVTVNFSWTPAINLTSDGEPQGNNQWISSSNNSSSVPVTLQGSITADATDPTGSTYSLSGSIENFTFTLMVYGSDTLSFIAISFDSLDFESGSGQGTSVTPSGLSTSFQGPLAFLNELQQFFSDVGDGSGPQIQVTPTDINVDLTVSLPPIDAGIFTLAGISFSTGLDLPLDGASMAVFSFAFASQDDPFTISGGIFGGDGYFVVQIGTKHVQLVTISLAFGAMLALDIVVASGSVSLTAGITFTMMTQGDTTSLELTAFVKLTGSLTVIGIITISVLFDLTMTWIGPDPNALSGTATISVSVSLFCFSTSVSMTASKTFAGGGSSSSIARRSAKALSNPQQSGSGSPLDFALTFADQMTESQWQNYYVTAFETQ